MFDQFKAREIRNSPPKYKAGYSHFGIYDEKYHYWKPICGGWSFGVDVWTINDKEVKCSSCLEKEPRANEILKEQEEKEQAERQKKYEE